MSVPVTFKGSNGDASINEASITETGEVRVASERYLKFENLIIPFTNATYGASLNQNGGFGGTPEVVHDGIDSVAWTGSNVIGGKVNFSNAERPHTGTLAVKVDNPAASDVWQFARTTPISMAGHTALTMWINIDKDWTTESISLSGFDTGTGLAVRNFVLVENYLNTTSFDTWHKAVIPLTDLGIEAATLDAFRFT